MTAGRPHGEEPAPSDPLRTHALVVGVGTYEAPDIKDRPGLAKTADRFARWLRGRGVPGQNIVLLGGSEGGPAQAATSANVDRALTEDLPGRDGELLWIFWVGHGIQDQDRRRRLVLADSTARTKRTLDLDELLTLYGTSYLEHFPRQLVVVDSCRTDLPAMESRQWSRPLGLPEPRERTARRTQRIWLAASAGEQAAYSAESERAWFSDTALDLLEAGGTLDWRPSYETVRDALHRRLEQVLPPGRRRQHPVEIAYGTERGDFREETVTALDPPGPHGSPPGGPRDGLRADDPVLAAYLRWLAERHRSAEISVADRARVTQVHAPLAATPWRGTLTEVRANDYTRRGEADHLLARSLDSGRSLAAELAERPLPTTMGPAQPVDRLQLPDTPPLPADELLGTVWRSLLLGDPGSGKSTLVRRLALEAAGPGPAAASDPAWRLPVLCRAAALAKALEAADGGPDGPGRAIGLPELATAAVTAGWDGMPFDPLSRDPVAPAQLAGLIGRAVATDRLLLMVDGLDEVPSREQWTRLVTLLNRTVEHDRHRTGLPAGSPGNQLVLTSRLTGFYAVPLSSGIRQLVLRPMEPSEALATGGWWLARYCALTRAGAAQTAVLTRRFEAVAGQDGDAAELAANPFLLVSVLSAVVSDALSGRGRPMVRSDLYRFMVDDALARASGYFPELSPDTLLAVQAAVAYRIHRTGHFALVPEEELAGYVTQALAALPEPPCSPDRATEVLHRLGLLIPRGHGVLGFVHQTLGEYLAARHLVAVPTAERIEPHLSDPRWVEPIRLATGHLARTDPGRLNAVLTELLAGPGGEQAARLLAGSLSATVPVPGPLVEAAVRALMAADVRRVAGGDHYSATAEVGTVFLESRAAPHGGEQPGTAVARALATALAASSGWELAAAARATEALGLYDRRIALALFEAQERDSSEYGWSTVRALQSMLVPVPAPEEDPAAAARVLAKLSGEERALLAPVRVREARRRVPRAIVPEPLAGSRLPFRTALDGPTAALVDAASPALRRVVLCLYGMVAFRDTRSHRETEHRLRSELVAEAEPAARQRAAVLLDTEVAADAGPGSGPGAGPLVGREWITVDSPLTGSVLRWLREGTTDAEIGAELLRTTRDRSADARTRGDALAAWLVLGTEGPTEEDPSENARTGGAEDPDGADTVVAEADEAVRQRLAWRLDRAYSVLSDAATRVSIGALVEEFHKRTVAVRVTRSLPSVRTRAAVTAARARFGLAPPPSTVPTQWRTASYGPPHPRGWPRAVPGRWSAAEDLLTLLHGQPIGEPPGLAAVLDTAAAAAAADDTAGLVTALARVHHREDDLVRHRRNWDLEPFTPDGLPAIPQALDAVDRLAPQLARVGCWLLDRLTVPTATEGLLAEALCVALSALPHDQVAATRTIRRLAARGGIPLPPPGDGPLNRSALLSGVAAMEVPDAVARTRLLVRVAALRGESVGADALTGPGTPAERLGTVALAVRLGTTGWSEELFQATLALAARHTGPAERAMAYARIAALADAPQQARQAEQLLAGSVAAIPDGHGGVLRQAGLHRYLTDRRAERSGSSPVDRFRLLTVHTLREVGGAAATGGWQWRGAHLPAALLSALAGAHPDKVYNLAVSLDTAGAALGRLGPSGTVRILATAHLTAPDLVPAVTDWDLDPQGPVTAPAAGEALTALAGLAPSLAFARCWLLERMAPRLVSDGYLVEALCLARADRRHDAASADRATLRLATAGGLQDAGPAELDAAVDRIDAPYPRGRARLRLASLLGRPLPTSRVVHLVTAVGDPLERLRLIELAVSLGSSAWTTELTELALGATELIVPQQERARAANRLTLLGPGAPQRDLPRWPAGAGTQAGHGVQVSPSGPLPETPLPLPLDLDDAWSAGGTGREQRDAWAVLSCAGRCLAALGRLRSAGPRALWHELARDPATRAATGRTLYRSGLREPLLLGPTEAAAVGTLVREGAAELAADLLAVAELRTRSAQSESWRHCGVQRVEDLATLLVIERGQLDAQGVAALPRLLDDPVPLVRLRTAVATSVVSRGTSGAPRFTTGALGAAGLAELVRSTRACELDRPPVGVELWWALTDVVHNSTPVLRETLGLLEDPEDRALLLSGVTQLTSETLPELAGLLTELDEPEQSALLHALQRTARHSGRNGADRVAVREMAGRLAPFAGVAASSEELLPQLLCLYGLVDPLGARTLRLLVRSVPTAPAPGDGNPVARSAAVGAIHGIGFLLEPAMADPGPPTADLATPAAVEEAVRVLRATALGADTVLAEAAVTALSRAGRRDLVDEALVAGDLAPATALWGLIGELDPFVATPADEQRIRRIRAFVLDPPAAAGTDTEHLTARLIEDLLTRASKVLRMPSAYRAAHGSTDLAWRPWPLLSILTELGGSAPGALRRTVNAGHPGFRADLARAFAEGGWAVQRSAVRLLLVLGRADREAVNALLAASEATASVQPGLFADLRWFDEVRPDGLTALFAASAAPQPARRHLAVRILASLVRGNLLDDAGHRTALDALRRSVTGPHLDDPLLREHQGLVLRFGTYGRMIREELTAVAAAVADRADRIPGEYVVLDVPDTTGEPLRLVAPAAPRSAVQDPMQAQVDDHSATGARQVSYPVLTALRRAMALAWEAGVPIERVLAAQRDEPDGPGG